MTPARSTTVPSDKMNWIAVLLGAAAAGMGMIYAYDRSLRQVSRKQVPPPVRNAGRPEMTMPPREWDQVDEAGDMSFPASDPPTNY